MNSRLKCHRLAWVVASGFTLTFQREVGYLRSWRPTGRLTSGVQRSRVRAGSSSTGSMTGSRRTAIQQMEAPIPRPTRPWFRCVAGAFTQLLVDLHADPFERAEDEAADYSHWRIDRSICSSLLWRLWDSASSPSGRSVPARSQRVSAWIKSCKDSPAHKTETTELIGDQLGKRKRGHTVIFDGYIPGVVGAISYRQVCNLIDKG